MNISSDLLYHLITVIVFVGYDTAYCGVMLGPITIVEYWFYWVNCTRCQRVCFKDAPWQYVCINLVANIVVIWAIYCGNIGSCDTALPCIRHVNAEGVVTTHTYMIYVVVG